MSKVCVRTLECVFFTRVLYILTFISVVSNCECEYMCMYIILSDNCGQSLPISSLISQIFKMQLTAYLLDMTRFCELKENFSITLFKHGEENKSTSCNMSNWPGGPLCMADWNAGRCCMVCHHLKWSEWCVMVMLLSDKIVSLCPHAHKRAYGRMHARTHIHTHTHTHTTFILKLFTTNNFSISRRVYIL